MPFLIPIIVGLGIAVAAGPIFVAVGSIALFNAMVGIGLSIALSGVSKLLQKKPNFAAIAHDALTRSVTVRQPISPRKIIYGSVGRLGGVITFLHVEGTNGEFLHFVITLAGHQVNAINTMYFDNVAVPLDGAGNATGNFAGFVFVEKNLGTTTQAAFADLVTKSGGKWTTAHQQKGRAGVHVRLKWDANKFPNGVPNITFDIDGALVYDPRSSTRAFSSNAALCLADYLTSADYGLGAATQKATRIQSSGGSVVTKFTGDTGLSTNGQAYEALVFIENIGAKDVTVADNFGHSVLVLAGTKSNVYLTWTGNGASNNQLIFKSPAAGDSLDFLLFNGILRRVGVDENQFTTKDFTGAQWTGGTGATVTLTQNQIASVEVDRAAIITAANICDEAITLNAGGTEPRYTTNGVIDTSVVPADAISSLLTAMAGFVVYTNATFKVYAGAYISPVSPDGDVSEGDLRGDIVIQTTRPKRDLFNGVKGLFVSPTNSWQPTDFPPKQNAAYVARDRGEFIWKDIELPFTTSVPTAQRLAKIDLERNARQISITLPLKLSKYTIAPLDTIRLSLARLGWVNKTFEVASVNLVFDDKGQQGYIIGVDVVARETDASVFSWTPGTDELASTAAQTIVQPDLSVTQPPTGLTVSPVEVVRIVDGIKTSGLSVSWTAPADQFVLFGGHIVVQYKKNADALWTQAGKLDGSVTSTQILGVVDGTLYNIRIWAENSVGVKSAIVSTNATPTGTVVAVPTGKNMLINPGFEANDVGSVLDVPTTVGGTLTNDWKVTQLSVYHQIYVTASAQHSGANSLLLNLPNSVTVPNDNTDYLTTAETTSRLYVGIGDIVRVSAWFKGFRNATPPAGVTVAYYIGITLYNAAGSPLGQQVAGFGDWSNAFLLLQTSIQIPATIGGGVPAYVKVKTTYQIKNNSGAPFATGASAYGVVAVDDFKCIVQNTAFDLTPVSTSGTPRSTTGLVSQIGATTAHSIASSTWQFGDGTIAYNSGTCDPTVMGTFYDTGDDPTYSGGAVTYVPRSTPADCNAANGRVFFGKITTVGAGGAVSTGGGTGGGGPVGKANLT